MQREAGMTTEMASANGTSSGAAATIEADSGRQERLVTRLFEAAIGTLDVFTIYVGDRLGLYRALDRQGTASSPELAAATDTDERYVREWLEQQAATGFLDVEDAAAEATARRYRIPPAHREVLLDQMSLNYLCGLLRLVVGATKPLPALLEAFRTGAGVPYADYGTDTVEGIAEMNRPMFLNLIGTEWLPAIPDVHARLEADPPARVADVGCGTGWSSIAIAQAYPKALVHGFDSDEPSIARARANAAATGLNGRLTFDVRDAAYPGLAGGYDLVTAFETIHDMAQPVEALRKMRGLVRPGGTVIVADERVGETFSAPGDDVERLNYGFSVLHCLAASMAESPSAATGTVMRPPTLRRYAAEAGFQEVEILPIENDFWRFYHLRP
jgi:2-polyprenyl-3-methyl-5-hydroxy-6-metoxy-1,4-benzoquinol methylase